MVSCTIPLNLLTIFQPDNDDSRNSPREIPNETEKSSVKDWRGPWPYDNFGAKPRLVGGKLIKPKFIDY